jgi:hypothetical protein
MIYMDAPDELIALRGDRVFNQLVQREAARLLGAAYDASRYDWTAEPPVDDASVCRQCYVWQRFPPGQRHFGYAWQRMCRKDCPCAVHDSEIWRAARAERVI